MQVLGRGQVSGHLVEHQRGPGVRHRPAAGAANGRCEPGSAARLHRRREPGPVGVPPPERDHRNAGTVDPQCRRELAATDPPQHGVRHRQIHRRITICIHWPLNEPHGVDLDRLSGSRHGLAGVSAALDGTARSGPAASGGVLLSAGISLGCRIAMSITMALMHLIMI